MSKKTVLIHSNFCKAFTGFGKNKKNILRYLFNTDKYNVVELANGKYFADQETTTLPWRCVGSLPDAQTLSAMKDPNRQRIAAYGSDTIDKIIDEIKPDVYIGIEDIWAFDGFMQRPWWKKLSPIIWTTLDSLPLLQSAVDAAPKIKNYYVWASFAEKAFQKIGYDHVKTLRGSLDTTEFFKLDDQKRKDLRAKAKVTNDFVIGFVFRNQLRKSVPNLLEAFAQFSKTHPNAKLLLHTHWSEGWNIPNLLLEKNIDFSKVLTTYYCNKCKQYEIKSFSGQELDCNKCGSKKSVNTTNIAQGVNENQLNEIYNIMDVYCHPFTSGGQEIPIQEAKLAELITLVTNYSCGEDYCGEDSAGLALEWSEYREPGTQFIKASTCPQSIADKLSEVYAMTLEERSELGARARQFVIDNCSIEVIGKQLEDLIDSMPFADYSQKDASTESNTDYKINNSLSDTEYVIDIHDKLLNDKIDANSSVTKHWVEAMQKGFSREQLLTHIKNIVAQQSFKPIDFSDVLDKDDEGRRLAVVIPDAETDVLLINGLLKNLKKQYPKYNIYIITKPQYFEYIEDNIYVHKCINYSESIDNPFILEGVLNHKGYFEIAFFPNTSTQKIITYVHNGQDKIQFPLQ